MIFRPHPGLLTSAQRKAADEHAQQIIEQRRKAQQSKDADAPPPPPSIVEIVQAHVAIEDSVGDKPGTARHRLVTRIWDGLTRQATQGNADAARVVFEVLDYLPQTPQEE